MREELDESTGRRQMTIIEDREKKLHPTIQIRKDTKKAEKLREFIIPVGAQLTVQRRRRGRARVTPSPRSAARSTRPATSPVVCRVWRSSSRRGARRIRRSSPRSTASISFGDIKRGKREVHVTPENGRAADVRGAGRQAHARPRGRPGARR